MVGKVRVSVEKRRQIAQAPENDISGVQTTELERKERVGSSRLEKRRIDLQCKEDKGEANAFTPRWQQEHPLHRAEPNALSSHRPVRTDVVQVRRPHKLKRVRVKDHVKRTATVATVAGSASASAHPRLHTHRG
ncbi:hypothetical protein BC830DRAFT_510833 [Chytriomyces sp. MP71]|nr:hypothetical protein BC830DRAFT_510833 [Chytriomyces sp. MP71]